MGRLRELPGRLADAYDRVQVELHGQYSLSRLEDLSQFSSNTSRWWVFGIIILTPLPALLAIITMDIAPLNSAFAGVYNQTMWYWIRVWFTVTLITMSTTMQFHQSAPTLPMPRRRLMVISLAVGASAPLCFFANGVLIGFPTPFAMQLYAIPWLFILVTALGISWLPTLRVDIEARHNLTTYLLAYSSELTIIFVYPVYFYIFTLLRGFSQTAFSLVLPVLKLIFKNWVSCGTFHMEDLAPTTIVFNIDVFHALFLSTAAQKSNSMGSILVIMAVDVVQMVVAFVEIDKVLARQKSLSDLLEVAHPASSTSNGPRVQPRRDAIGFARRLVRTNTRLRDHPDLALPRHLRRQPPRLLSSFSIRLPRHSVLKVLPQNAEEKTTFRVQSSFTTDAERIQVKNVACTLQILHMTEFYVLIEFVEVMMSCSLVIYLEIIRRLPNRVHYETLRTLSDEDLRAMIARVAIYALLELVSLIVLYLGLNRKLKGFSSIGQLAFVLRRHWEMAQASLVLWTVFVMQLSLTHVGSDYSFKFAWLHSNSTLHQ